MHTIKVIQLSDTDKFAIPAQRVPSGDVMLGWPEGKKYSPPYVSISGGDLQLKNVNFYVDSMYPETTLWKVAFFDSIVHYPRTAAAFSIDDSIFVNTGIADLIDTPLFNSQYLLYSYLSYWVGKSRESRGNYLVGTLTEEQEIGLFTRIFNEFMHGRTAELFKLVTFFDEKYTAVIKRAIAIRYAIGSKITVSGEELKDYLAQFGIEFTQEDIDFFNTYKMGEML